MAITKLGDDKTQNGVSINGPLYVRTSSGTLVTVINADGSINEAIGLVFSDGDSLNDNNGNELLTFGVVSSAVNHVKLKNAATGNNPKLQAVGDDANVNIDIAAKGTGRISLLSEANLSGYQNSAQALTANSDNGPNSTLTSHVRSVDVQGITTDANDWIILPSLASVPVGHEIIIACNAGSNFELRTPATSGEKINNVNSDGTAEYLCTDTDTVRIWKLSNADGWVAQSITNLGAVRTAVVPD